MATTSVIPEVERRAALDAVVGSKTFDRSEQLKSFLRYVCEQEWQGRGDALSEYAIGVHALGRPETFSPIEDSIVRNRAYALRKKLDEYYGAEGVADAVRIELPKGSYAPQFHVARAATPPASPSTPDSSPVVIQVQTKTRLWWCLTTLAALVAGAGLMHLWERARLVPEPPSAIRQLWGSLVDPAEEVILCVSTPPSVFLRTYPVEDPPVGGVMPLPDSLRSWLLTMRSAKQDPDEITLMVPNLNSPLWGDSAAATRIARTLARHGIRSDLTAERLLKLPALRNRSVVFLGSTEYSPGVTRLLHGLPLQLDYDLEAKDHIALELDTQSRIIRRYPVERRQLKLTSTWGLLTFLPGEGDGQVRRRYLVVSGVSSAGTLGAAEFATSEAHLAKLLEKTGGVTGGPSGVLQVLVRVNTDQTLPMHFEYADHRLR